MSNVHNQVQAIREGLQGARGAPLPKASISSTRQQVGAITNCSWEPDPDSMFVDLVVDEDGEHPPLVFITTWDGSQELPATASLDLEAAARLEIVLHDAVARGMAEISRRDAAGQ